MSVIVKFTEGPGQGKHITKAITSFALWNHPSPKHLTIFRPSGDQTIQRTTSYYPADFCTVVNRYLLVVTAVTLCLLQVVGGIGDFAYGVPKNLKCVRGRSFVYKGTRFQDSWQICWVDERGRGGPWETHQAAVILLFRTVVKLPLREVVRLGQVGITLCLSAIC